MFVFKDVIIRWFAWLFKKALNHTIHTTIKSWLHRGHSYPVPDFWANVSWRKKNNNKKAVCVPIEKIHVSGGEV